MKYNKEAWLANVKQAVVDLKTDQPTGGKPTAIAGLRYIRNNLLDEIGVFKVVDGKTAIKDGKPVYNDEKWTSQGVAEAVRESFSELIQALSTGGVDEGFLSNASAAAKAAGFKGTTAAALTLVD